MGKDVKERLAAQIKKLSREELEARYLQLLCKLTEGKKAKAKLHGTLSAITKQTKKKGATPKTNRKEEYYQELTHPLWLKKRKLILDRDEHKCAICKSSENLQVHHLKYKEGKKAWQYPNITLITLCKECHNKVHTNKDHELYPKFE